MGLFIFVPLAAFVITLLWKNKEEKLIGRVVRLSKVFYIMAALAFAAGWAINGLKPIQFKLATLYQSEDFVFAVQFYYDEVTAVFSIVGSLLFFLVATFSKYYMHRDEGYKRFFNTILLFAAGFNFIIFSGNFETLFIGWEIKGICSFLLIAFYRNRYLPVKNAFKTISNYRISDVAVMLAMWMMHHLTHRNISFTEIGQARDLAAQTGQGGMAVFIMLMIVLAATVKSAQFPFTTWLPRAMEGPTSSSAIFYGSLSVHIGVFLLLRTHDFWAEMEWVKITVIVIGALTALFATMIARVQPNVKTQIAYSSAAQIGIMFIEIALGFHWLVLIHFAGNAFLRTYQLLVSPSVLNYLVHHQYFHYHPPKDKPVGKVKATLYMMGVKEWNLDTLMFRYLWSPFKWIGGKLHVLKGEAWMPVSLLGVSMAFLTVSVARPESLLPYSSYFSAGMLVTALALVLYAFAHRGSALTAWTLLPAAHFFILAGINLNAEAVRTTEIIFYAGGILLVFLVGTYCLQGTRKIDNDIRLDKFHGYVYEQRNSTLFFMIAAIGMLGFPVTTAFIGIDVLFTYIHGDQVVLITLLALCFIFIELASIRIFLRIYLGPHTKLYHPVAFRSS